MKFLSFFRRKPQWVPPVGDGTVFGNWSPGDLAVCIMDGMWADFSDGHIYPLGPTKGEVLKVAGTGFVLNWHVLYFEKYGMESGFVALNFRKAVLDKAEACEEDFVKLLKRSRQKVGV